ncbi:acryloyl-CoA reductase [Planctomicrobium sp. SH661]|uniref:acrylyl-CoA reductase family protein n=1 Tax=Planctomicrobium sp. SH661 TaxID=3448124 RepID=UPI003F5CAC24
MSDRFRCFMVRKEANGDVATGIEEHHRSELPSGDVLLKVRYSSLNYKDAMAATANPAIAKTLPHVPGIDAVGTVLESSDARFQPGDEVIATGHEFGVERWGGWGELLSAPGDWLVPLPSGLTALEAMTLGTAGFTAAQCVQALLHQGLTPEKGEIVVTGATGGVGSLAIMILSQLGFRTVAVSGKAEQHDWLKSIGASEVAGRDLLTEAKPRPLLNGRFAGGVDSVGGATLATLCKMIAHRGCVACCGMAGGNELQLTVFPFILRGLTLAGIDSAWCPDDLRAPLWQKLAQDWKLQNLDRIRTLATLEELPGFVKRILQGENVGRVVVALT